MPLPKTRKLKWALIVGGLLIAILLALFLLIWNGILHPNALAADAYEVRGVDVSHYQGEIDWTVLAGNGIDFVFLKATEGSTYVDETFAENLKGAGGKFHCQCSCGRRASSACGGS